MNPLQGRYLTQTQNKHRIHALSGIHTHDPSVQAGEDISCLDRVATVIGTEQFKIHYMTLGRNCRDWFQWDVRTCAWRECGKTEITIERPGKADTGVDPVVQEPLKGPYRGVLCLRKETPGVWTAYLLYRVNVTDAL
jgi:hypothetical protein